MQRITAMTKILSLLLLLGIAPPALAGIVPSPHGSMIGDYLLNFDEGYALTASHMVKAVLTTPPDDNREVFAIKQLARQLDKLERLMALTTVDVISLGSTPDDTIPGAATPPDDVIPPEGLEALGQLLESAKVLNDSALADMDELTEVER